MQAIKTQLTINRVTIKKDDSVSFSVDTPSLTDEELGAFRKLSKVVVNALLEPEEGSSDTLTINEKVDDGKSPSQRLRSVIFVWWEQTHRTDDFETFYRMTMEKLIDGVKSKLV